MKWANISDSTVLTFRYYSCSVAKSFVPEVSRAATRTFHFHLNLACCCWSWPSTEVLSSKNSRRRAPDNTAITVVLNKTSIEIVLSKFLLSFSCFPFFSYFLGFWCCCFSSSWPAMRRLCFPFMAGTRQPGHQLSPRLSLSLHLKSRLLPSPLPFVSLLWSWHLLSSWHQSSKGRSLVDIVSIDNLVSHADLLRNAKRQS